MELALEFWSLPFQFLSNASADLLGFCCKMPWGLLGALGACLDLRGNLLGLPWDPLGSMDQKSRETNEFGHSFVTKSVRFGRTELSLRLRKALGEFLRLRRVSGPVF